MFQAKIVLDSISPDGHRLTAVAATYPRFIHSEILTHRDRARNAASSRAIPWKKFKTGFPVLSVSESAFKPDHVAENCMMGMILRDPVIPIKWGAEQKGMQAGGEIPLHMAHLAEHLWILARDSALMYADMIANIGQAYYDVMTGKLNLGDYVPMVGENDPSIQVHKSLPNRITEPWMWITTLMSATSWRNFFRLRCHPDAEVHFQKIAGMIRDAMASSIPNKLGYGDWHLPYIRPDDYELLQADVLADVEGAELDAMSREVLLGKLKKVSAGRCARLSYLTHEGKRDPQADIDLCDRLINRTDDVLHASPLEHVAQCHTADHRSGPFRGWKQFRKEFSNECADD
jgi:hypothetical protein